MFAAMKKVVCLVLWLCVSQGSEAYISTEMNKTLQNLRQHYKLSSKDLYDGNPVFPRDPPVNKLESRMLFMGGILEAYEKLFGHMLKELPTANPQLSVSRGRGASTAGPSAAADVGSNLMKILQKIRALKKSRYQEQVRLLHGLQHLKHIKMDDIKTQSKALGELDWIYEEASELAENVARRRRRRQTRIKSRLAA